MSNYLHLYRYYDSLNVDAYPVEGFWSRLTTGTSFTFYWMIAAPFRQAIVQAASTSAVLTDLHPGTNYNCSIFTVGPLGISAPKSHNITTPEAGETKVISVNLIVFLCNSSFRISRDVWGSSWRERSVVLLVSPTSHPAKWSHHQLHPLLLPLPLLPPPVPVLPVLWLSLSCWLLSQHSLLQFSDC